LSAVREPHRAGRPFRAHAEWDHTLRGNKKEEGPMEQR
jgi:hypothetical protein